jgi:hypothetical protein
MYPFLNIWKSAGILAFYSVGHLRQCRRFILTMIGAAFAADNLCVGYLLMLGDGNVVSFVNYKCVATALYLSCCMPCLQHRRWLGGRA